MEKFELIAGEIFDDEFEAFKDRDRQNTPEEAKAINQMMGFIQQIVLENYDKYMKKLTPMHVEIFIGESDDVSRKHRQFEKEFTPIPYYFVLTADRIMCYANCYEEVGYDQKDRFSLFLAFKFRNASPYDIQSWLDYLNKQHGDMTAFFKIHLDMYGFLYPQINLKLALEWLALKTKPGVEVETIPEESVTTGTLPLKALPDTVINGTGSYIEKLRIDENLLHGLIELLTPYFDPEATANLKKVLLGEKIEEKVIFQNNGNKLLGVFWELLSKKKINNSKSFVERMILESFRFHSSKSKQIEDFSNHTVHRAISGTEHPVSKKNRIDLSVIFTKEK